MAASEKKLAEEFAVLGGHENEHPELAQYIRAVADSFQAIAEDHFVFVRIASFLLLDTLFV